MAGRAQDGGLPHRGKKNLLMLVRFWFWTLRTERGSDGVSLPAGSQSETRVCCVVWMSTKLRLNFEC